MLSIERSKQILNRRGLNYTEEEIKRIREFINILAEIDYRLWERKRQEKANQFQKDKESKIESETKAENKIPETERNITEMKIVEKNKKLKSDETQSHSIHPREYRRAS